MKEVTQNSYKLSIDKVLGHLSMSGHIVDDNVRSLFFGDYMSSSERIYDEVSDLKELTKVMERSVECAETLNMVVCIVALEKVVWTVRLER